MTALVLRGDARALPLPDASVDLVVTSPPFLNLRSYTDGGSHYQGQIGTGTRDQFLEDLWEATEEMARVLKPTGSIFVELGDSYTDKCLNDSPHRYAIGCVDKLGLIKRAEIIWNRPNGLPESVTDPVRRSHSVWFHFTRQPRYFAAVDEIREGYSPNKPWGSGARSRESLERALTGVRSNPSQQQTGIGTDAARVENPLGKLPGSVWDIPSEPLTVPEHLGVDHFAAFPSEWPRRIILGWSPSGICTGCGEGRRPIVDAAQVPSPAHRDGSIMGSRRSTGDIRGWDGLPRFNMARTLTGYVCACTDSPGPKPPEAVDPFASDAVSRARKSPEGRIGATTRPAVVLDPFGGTGTTALAATMLGRTGISIDRSADYSRLAAWRTNDPAQRAKVLGVPKPPPVMDGQDDLLALLDGVA